VLILVLNANITDYLLDKKKDNTKCKTMPKLFGAFPISTSHFHLNEWTFLLNP